MGDVDNGQPSVLLREPTFGSRCRRAAGRVGRSHRAGSILSVRPGNVDRTPRRDCHTSFYPLAGWGQRLPGTSSRGRGPLAGWGQRLPGTSSRGRGPPGGRGQRLPGTSSRGRGPLGGWGQRRLSRPRRRSPGTRRGPPSAGQNSQNNSHVCPSPSAHGCFVCGRDICGPLGGERYGCSFYAYPEGHTPGNDAPIQGYCRTRERWKELTTTGGRLHVSQRHGRISPLRTTMLGNHATSTAA